MLGAKKLKLYRDQIIQDLGSRRFNFLLNSVYIGNTEIISWNIEYSPLPEKVTRFYKEQGVKIETIDLSEFSPLGGSARCLTLFLD